MMALFSLLLSCRSPALFQEDHKTVVEPAYDRKTWKHWIDEDKNCLNTRQEILKKRSKIPVVFTKSGCSVKSGQWEDYYYPEVLTDAKRIDIDHLVPLKHANNSGGDIWTKDKKQEFANDSENLVITNLKYNRQKGSQGIDTWLPSNKDYACKYMKDWVHIKTKYNLSFSSEEQKSIKLFTEQGCSIPEFLN